MATKGVTGKQHDVDRENGGAHTDAERTFSGGGIDKPKGFPDIVGQNPKEEESKIEKITVHILHDERERTFTPITLARLTDGARGRIGPERFVVRSAVVIAGDPKASRRPENQ